MATMVRLQRRTPLLVRFVAFLFHSMLSHAWVLPGVIGPKLLVSHASPFHVGRVPTWRCSIHEPKELHPEKPTRVHLVVPALNEEKIILGTLEALSSFLESKPSWHWNLTVVDNGCTDDTHRIASEFVSQRQDQKVSVMTVPQRGRGQALRSAWLGSDAAVQCYCDADLSSDLESLAQAVELVAAGHCDVAVASRVAPGSAVIGRTLLRDITSYGYILLLRLCFWDANLSDCQCGCKAISSAVADDVLPLVENNGWFFDTELLLLAAGSGFRIREVPVTWQDDRDSRVKVASTILEMIKGIVRLKVTGWRNRVVRNQNRTPDQLIARREETHV